MLMNLNPWDQPDFFLFLVTSKECRKAGGSKQKHKENQNKNNPWSKRQSHEKKTGTCCIRKTWLSHCAGSSLLYLLPVPHFSRCSSDALCCS